MFYVYDASEVLHRVALILGTVLPCADDFQELTLLHLFPGDLLVAAALANDLAMR